MLRNSYRRRRTQEQAEDFHVVVHGIVALFWRAIKGKPESKKLILVAVEPPRAWNLRTDRGILAHELPIASGIVFGSKKGHGKQTSAKSFFKKLFTLSVSYPKQDHRGDVLKTHCSSMGVLGMGCAVSVAFQAPEPGRSFLRPFRVLESRPKRIPSPVC